MNINDVQVRQEKKVTLYFLFIVLLLLPLVLLLFRFTDDSKSLKNAVSQNASVVFFQPSSNDLHPFVERFFNVSYNLSDFLPEETPFLIQLVSSEESKSIEPVFTYLSSDDDALLDSFLVDDTYCYSHIVGGIVNYSFNAELLKTLAYSSHVDSEDNVDYKAAVELIDVNSTALLIHMDQLTKAISPFLVPAFEKQFNIFRSISGWIRFDFLEDASIGNGTLYCGMRKGLYKNLNIEPFSQSNLYNIIPSNAASVEVFDVAIVEKLIEGVSERSKHTILTFMTPWIDHVVANVLVDFSSSNIKKSSFLVFKTKDVSLTHQLLTEWINRNGGIVDSSGSYTYYHLLENEVFNDLLGNRFLSIENPFLSIIGGHVVLSNSKLGLDRWMEKLRGGDNCSIVLSNSHIKSPNYSLVIQPNHFRSLIDDILNVPLQEAFSAFFADTKSLRLAVNTVHSKVSLNIQTSTSKFVKPIEDSPQDSLVTASFLLNTHAAPIRLNKANTGVFYQNESNQLVWQTDKSEPVFIETDKSIEDEMFSQVKSRELASCLFVLGNALCAYNSDGQFEVIRRFSSSNLKLLSDDYLVTNDYIYHLNDKAIDSMPTPSDWISPSFKYSKGHLAILEGPRLCVVNVKDKKVLFDEQIVTVEKVVDWGVDINSKSARVVLMDDKLKCQIVNLQAQTFGLLLSQDKPVAPLFKFVDVVGDSRKDYLLVNGNRISLQYYDKFQFEEYSSFTTNNMIEDVWVEKIGRKKQLVILDDNNRLSFYSLTGTLMSKPFFVDDYLGVVEISGSVKIVVLKDGIVQFVDYPVVTAN